MRASRQRVNSTRDWLMEAYVAQSRCLLMRIDHVRGVASFLVGNVITANADNVFEAEACEVTESGVGETLHVSTRLARGRILFDQKVGYFDQQQFLEF